MKKHIIIAIIMFFIILTPLTDAITLGADVVIKPNSTANGSYINNHTAVMDTITVNDTDVVFGNIDTNNRLVLQSADGTVLTVLCWNQADCTLSQAATNLFIYFLNNITLSQLPSTITVVGGGSATTTAGAYYDFTCEQKSCYGCDLKCAVVLKNTNNFPVNITANYDMYFNNKKQTITKIYELNPQQIKTVSEYFTIYSASKDWSEQFNNFIKDYESSKIIATFTPYQSQNVVVFSVKSFFEMYKNYLIVFGMVLLIIYFTKKRKKKQIISVKI